MKTDPPGEKRRGTLSGPELPAPPSEEGGPEQGSGALLDRFLGELVAGRSGGLALRIADGRAQVEDSGGNLLFTGMPGWHDAFLADLRKRSALPQDGGSGALQRGHFATADGKGEAAHFRISILAGVSGAEAHVRLLGRESRTRGLRELGFTASQELTIRQALARPGLVWVTCNGSEGVASTLFGLLRAAPEQGRALTLEDEVFYRSPDLVQVETCAHTPEHQAEVVRELKYLEFRRVLVDRVTPGQLKDLLALTLRRRWVFAASAEPGLREALAVLAGQASALPLYGLRLVIHQRLVPELCPQCRVPFVLGTGDEKALARILVPAGPVYQVGDGCQACSGRGVTGPRAFFEVLPVDPGVREALYAEGRGEARLDRLTGSIRPSVRDQVAEEVVAGRVSLAELWDLL